jgi:hypothetical protein
MCYGPASLRPPFFPPPPARFVGRATELRALSARIASGKTTRIALVGPGGSGKSLLACALGHRLRRHYPGGVHWFRVGAWDASTLFEMLARRLGVATADRAAAVRRALERRGRTLIVLDNHESDRAMARLLEALRTLDVTWILTARRCLLAGVDLFPVVPPLATSGRSAFRRVAALTGLLRYHPLALDIADRLVASRAISVTALGRWLVDHGIEHLSVMVNEDDIAAVRLLVDWAWPRLPPGGRAMLGVLAYSEGDDIDGGSLARLARLRSGARDSLQALRRWHLVQEPLAGRFAVHAVVRQAVQRRTRVARSRYFRHYVRLLERHPERVDLEQTHLFAAMDHAHAVSDLGALLRLERLLARLGAHEGA